MSGPLSLSPLLPLPLSLSVLLATVARKWGGCDLMGEEEVDHVRVARERGQVEQREPVWVSPLHVTWVCGSGSESEGESESESEGESESESESELGMRECVGVWEGG